MWLAALAASPKLMLQQCGGQGVTTSFEQADCFGIDRRRE
jgi:hypothetical protein